VLETCIGKGQGRQRQKERQAGTRRKILAGGAVLDEAEQRPDRTTEQADASTYTPAELSPVAASGFDEGRRQPRPTERCFALWGKAQPCRMLGSALR